MYPTHIRAGGRVDHEACPGLFPLPSFAVQPVPNGLL
jgi:hypothetical protein